MWWVQITNPRWAKIAQRNVEELPLVLLKFSQKLLLYILVFYNKAIKRSNIGFCFTRQASLQEDMYSQLHLKQLTAIEINVLFSKHSPIDSFDWHAVRKTENTNSHVKNRLKTSFKRSICLSIIVDGPSNHANYNQQHLSLHTVHGWLRMKNT